MNKKDRLQLEAATHYMVTASKLADIYDVRRFVDGTFDAWYTVTIVWDRPDEPHYPKIIWCDCMGFKHQKFAHIDHKHLKLVMDFQSRGEPEWAKYRIHGTGAKTTFTHLESSDAETQVRTEPNN